MTATGRVRPDETLRAMSQVNTGNWCQETYETGTGEAARRAKQLRSLGYVVVCSAMGLQVTKVGLVKLTLVDIRRGSHGDTFGLPEVERFNV